jgi:hypothetical protein
MSIFAKIGLFFAMPFLAVGAWFSGIGHHPPSNTNLNQTAVVQQLATSSAGTTNTTPIPTGTGGVIQSQSVSSSHSVVELDAISPVMGVVGDTITLSGSGFTSSNTVLFGGNTAAKNVPLASFTNGHQELTFTVPSALAPNCPVGHPCPMYMRVLSSGNYQVTVENSNGTSQPLTFVVTGDTTL